MAKKLILSVVVLISLLAFTANIILAGTNDIEAVLGDSAGANKFQVQNSGSTPVFQVDSLGSMTASVITSTGSITATGTITASGNVQATKFIGDGSLLTGIVSASSATTLTGVIINTTGTLSVSNGNFVVDNTGSVTAAANITSGGLIVRGGNFHVDTNGSVTVAANITSGGLIVRGGNFDVDANGSVTAMANITSGGLIVRGGNFHVDTNGSVTASGNIISHGTITANSYTFQLDTGTASVYMPAGTETIHINGSLHVEGNLSKLTGTFDIPHPDKAKVDGGYRLRHSFVESPTRGDNLYRYEVVIESDEGETVIDLPSYWEFLNENPQVWVTPVGQFAKGYGYVDDELGVLKVKGEKKGTYNVLLIGTRKDEFAKKFWDPRGVEYKVVDD